MPLILKMRKARRFVLKNGDIKLYLRVRKRYYKQAYHEPIVLTFRRKKSGAKILGFHRMASCTADNEEKEQPIYCGDERYFAVRADTVVFASGYLVLDLVTGVYRRFSGLPHRAFEVIDWLNRFNQLTKKYDQAEWPKNLLREIRNARARLWLLGWRGPL